MDRFVDAAAVLLLAGATAFIGLAARGTFDARDADADAMTAPLPEPPATYEARVAAVVPALERHVAAGSWKARDPGGACVADERRRLAELDAIEAELLDARAGVAGAPEIAGPLADAIEALRACVSCAPEKRGCADAARALTVLESRLGLPRSAGGI